MTADGLLMDGGSNAPPTPPRNAPAEHLATPDVTLSQRSIKGRGRTTAYVRRQFLVVHSRLGTYLPTNAAALLMLFLHVVSRHSGLGR